MIPERDLELYDLWLAVRENGQRGEPGTLHRLRDYAQRQRIGLSAVYFRMQRLAQAIQRHPWFDDITAPSAPLAPTQHNPPGAGLPSRCPPLWPARISDFGRRISLGAGDLSPSPGSCAKGLHPLESCALPRTGPRADPDLCARTCSPGPATVPSRIFALLVARTGFPVCEPCYHRKYSANGTTIFGDEQSPRR